MSKYSVFSSESPFFGTTKAPQTPIPKPYSLGRLIHSRQWLRFSEDGKITRVAVRGLIKSLNHLYNQVKYDVILSHR